jgi:ATP-binding cassette, subfamily C, bacterial
MTSGVPGSGLRGFIAALTGERRGLLAWVIAVQAVAGLLQAFGVLLLVPLLGAVGVGGSRGISRWTRHLFLAVGLRPTLATVLVIYVGVTAANASLNAYQSVLMSRYRLDVINNLRRRLYAAVSRAEWRHLMVLRRADLLAVLTANVTLVGGGVTGLLGVIVAMIVVAAQLVAAVQISPPMTGLAVVSGAALVAVVWPLVRRSRRLSVELIALNRQAMRLANSFLDSLKLTKAYGREHDHELAYAQAVSQARDAQVSFALASGVANAVQGTLTAALLGLTVYVAVRIVHVPVGSLLVVALVFNRVVSQIVSSQSSIQSVAQALPAFDEVSAMIAECEGAQEMPDVAARSHRRIGIGAGVALEDVHFTYPGSRGDRREALCGVCLELPPGSTIALAGPSGAGKTTISDLVAGLILPTVGQVTVDGRALTRERLLAWRRSVALVPQDPFLFHETIDMNLRWARPEATTPQLWGALRMANAAEFVGELPQGLETVVGDRGTRLSGGERQRLALARALLREPELLLLDEATSSLDTESELAIRTALSSLSGRTTILLIAHRLSTVSEADQIVVLDAGRVVESGTWTELAALEAGRLQSLIEAGSVAVTRLGGRDRGSP